MSVKAGMAGVRGGVAGIVLFSGDVVCAADDSGLVEAWTKLADGVRDAPRL